MMAGGQCSAGQKQPYVNLPDTGSDSLDDDINGAASVALHGTKVRRHKRTRKMAAMRSDSRRKSYDGGTSLCSFWTFAKNFICVLVLASVVVLGAISYWLQQQIQVLKDEVAAVEARNKDAPETLQALHSQLLTVNHSVQLVRNGKMELDHITKNISSQVDALKSSVESISSNPKAGPGLKGLTDRFDVLSKDVADMGSNVESLKTQLSEMKKSYDAVQARVATLEGGNREVSGSQANMPPARTPFQEALSQRLDRLEEGVNSLNGTCSTQFQMLSQRLQLHESRLTSLQELTSKLSANVTSLTARTGPNATVTQQQMHAHISNMLQSAMSPTEAAAPTEAGSDQPPAEELLSMRTLAARVDNISAILAGLQHQHSQIVDDHTSLGGTANLVSSDFQHQTEQDIKRLNVTVGRLEGEVDQLFAKLTQQTNSLVTVNHTVVSLAGLLHAKGVVGGGQSPGAGSAPTTPATTPTTTATTPTTIATTPTKAATPSDGNKDKMKTPASTTMAETPIEGGTAEAPRDNPLTEPVADDSLKSSSSTGIQIEGINNLSDLKLSFARWDSNDGNRLVSYLDLHDHLGPQTPDKERLKDFDSNNDDQYSMEEMAAALGIALTDEGAR